MIELKGVSFGYRLRENAQNFLPVLENISTTLMEGKLSVFVGPSGCGKTTLLNLLAGLIEPSGGTIDYHGLKSDRRVGYVFQAPSLIPWYTIRQNALFGIEVTNQLTPQSLNRCNQLLIQYGLGGFENSYPLTLSIGMQQRVSIIRAVLSGAKIILLDEPFSNSDFLMRRELQRALSTLISEDQFIAVMVTHDIDEAVRIGDKVMVLTERPASIKGQIDIPIPREERAKTGSAQSVNLSSYMERIEMLFTNTMSDCSLK